MEGVEVELVGEGLLLLWDYFGELGVVVGDEDLFLMGEVVEEQGGVNRYKSVVKPEYFFNIGAWNLVVLGCILAGADDVKVD